MCNYFRSGHGYVLYNGNKLKVDYYTYSSNKKGGGYFEMFRLVFPDGSKRVVKAKLCQIIVM